VSWPPTKGIGRGMGVPAHVSGASPKLPRSVARASRPCALVRAPADHPPTRHVKQEGHLPEPNPTLIVIAGPNGAGKTTAAPNVLRRHTDVAEFVNADLIAKGLSPFQPESASMAAGRIMLARVRELAGARSTFAFETTLASRTFAPWIKSLISTGYEFHLVYLWLPNAEVAKRRVKGRVLMGGHSVPEQDIERRYSRGLWNLRNLYIPLAKTWFVYDSSSNTSLRPIAKGSDGKIDRIDDPTVWRSIEEVSAQ
jgi:predicted ABC-type ATPase